MALSPSPASPHEPPVPPDCPFCSPRAEQVFHEGELVRGLWDAFPVSPGHALLVTRRHVPTWFEATDAERAELTAATLLARQTILRHYPAEGFNLGVNAGEVAGQTVPHLHLHVIPRVPGDVPDPRGGVRHVIPGKANYLAPGAAGPHPRLLTRGEEEPLLGHLRLDIDRAQQLDVAVAFVMPSGVERLYSHFQDLLARGGTLRLVTGDYLGITDPGALRRLLDLGLGYAPQQLQLRVFSRAGTSFHPKAYLCRAHGGEGVAYVGSSNLSRSALEEGVEWNYRIVTSRDRAGFGQAVEAFESLFQHPSTQALDAQWVDRYETRRRTAVAMPPVVDAEMERVEPPPPPNAIQRRALAALEETRARGNRAGLVVLATGLGKTWLSAFDSDRPEFRRVLFVAHREEILDQALKTFRRIRPSAHFGRYSGQEKAPRADILFASIQTLGRQAHLDHFDPRAFDYIVVDEFHHASAKTYRRLLEHFEPAFLLGLTATPERSDGGDLLQLCGENLVFRCDLVDGIRRELLCPFHYFGVPDEVDYRNIPWRSTRFDEEALTSAVATQARAQNILEQWRSRGGARTLGFCVSQRHADFMRDYFKERGVRCAAVHSGPTSAPRASSLERLAAGELQVVFAVDMFNEGVDLPAIDTVMMLRPTESQILWLQQFGRGLRRSEGKSHLTVIDYIGNHRTFLLKPRALLGLPTGNDRELSAALERLQHGEWELPPGCEATYELKALDLLRGLLRLPKAGDALRTYYEDFRERHGERPTATEAHHDGYAPRSARKSYGSWLGFVRAMGDLSPAAQAALETASGFLDALEVTQMTKSYKMLVVQALLNRDALPGTLAIEELVSEVRRLAERSAQLRADVGDALQSPSALRTLLERNPIDAWTGAKGTGGRAYFAYDGSTLRSTVDVSEDARPELQGLARELVDWRLAEYLGREGVEQAAEGFMVKVNQSGGRPILFPLERDKVQGIPEGWTKVEVDGNTYDANFVKVALNVVRKPGEEQNELPAILRTWFGPDAGQPGTNHLVACEPAGEGYRLKPVGKQREVTLEPWREYSREQIPALFGLQFSEAIWNSGFVATEKHLFLLVTLEKGAMTENFKYSDRFLDPLAFQWQSQNRTAKDSKHGRALKNHVASGVQVQLFVRAQKKRTSGSAAPFIYCGPVTFASWQGEKPITIHWALSEPVPHRLGDVLRVPRGG
nr:MULTISPECIES: DUF3427 domain-containing protein [Myxococcaceae]